MSDHVLGFMVLFAFGFSWPLEKAGGWLLNHRFPREAPAGAHGGEQLSPAQAGRLSDWLAGWYRLRVDEGTRDHRRVVEDAIARIYERRRPSLRFRWVDSPGAALAAGVPARAEAGSPRTGPPVPRGRELINRGQGFGPRFGSLASAGIRAAFLGLPSASGDRQTVLGAPLEATSRLPDLDGVGAAFDDYTSYLACHRDVLGLRYDRLVSRYLDFQMRTAGCFGWWWRDDNVLVLLERPTVMHRDDRGLLHHPRGAAVTFRDGFAAYVWHGTAVPGAWITAPETLRPLEALNWPDRAQRRAALEIIGWKRVIEDLHPRTIDAAADPSVGQLVEAMLPGSGAARFLRVRCGTGREFVLAVPPWMRTALEANAWTYGLSANEYHLEVRT